MIWPDWQWPLCGTSFSPHGDCNALPSLVWPTPSMVVIFLPTAAESGVEQDRAGWPFTCTVQAPHNAMPQPYLVPVMLRWSRRTQRRGVSGSASTDTPLPLTFRVVIWKFLVKNPRCYCVRQEGRCEAREFPVNGCDPGAGCAQGVAGLVVRGRGTGGRGVGSGHCQRGGHSRRDDGRDGRPDARSSRRSADPLRCAAGGADSDADGLSHLYRIPGGSLGKTIDRESERDKQDRQGFLHLCSLFLGIEEPDSRIIDSVSGLAAGPARPFLMPPSARERDSALPEKNQSPVRPGHAPGRARRPA